MILISTEDNPTKLLRTYEGFNRVHCILIVGSKLSPRRHRCHKSTLINYTPGGLCKTCTISHSNGDYWDGEAGRGFKASGLWSVTSFEGTTCWSNPISKGKTRWSGSLCEGKGAEGCLTLKGMTPDIIAPADAHVRTKNCS